MHKNWQALSADEEKDLARRILACEQRALEAIRDFPCAQPLLSKRAKGSERTRAGRVDRIAAAVELAWKESREDPQRKEQARAAKAALEEAERLRWELAMSGRRIALGEARKLQGAYLDEVDLTQEGFVGLLRAAKRFDPDRDIRFGTYARWWVRAQMTRAIDMHGRMVRLPGCAVEQLRNLRKAQQDYDRAGVDYKIEDLAEQAGIESERAEFLLSRGRTVSLDEPADEGEKARPVGAFLADEDAMSPDDRTVLNDDLVRMLQAVEAVLDPRQKRVVTQRYGLVDGEFHSLSEIARQMDLSRERVRQIERDALEALRRATHLRAAA